MSVLVLPNTLDKEQFPELSGRAIFDGDSCQYADEVKPGDLVAANFDVKHVHTGGGLYLLESRVDGRVTWRGCRRMIFNLRGSIDVDENGRGEWVTVPDLGALNLHIVGTIETVCRPTRDQ